ncbi:hypothetical protein KRP22_009548 [Phytophthora ramorum]|nr:hypothetical protein KRP22_8381 [Phytophthora ramorum]
MTEPTKRKNFSDIEDVLLLKQALADDPYSQEHGKVMERWNSLAATLVPVPGFLRKNLTGKTAQNRVNALLATAQKKNNAAARLSGVTESHSEKDKIKAEKNAEKESAGETIRKLALERLKRRRTDDGDQVSESPSKSQKFSQLVELIREQKEKELEAKQKQWEQERLDRQATEKRFMQLLELLAKRG